LITEDPTPVRVTDALPWRSVAVSMFASWIRSALITEFASPSWTTPVTTKHTQSRQINFGLRNLKTWTFQDL
jgi:hypothetical protein